MVAARHWKPVIVTILISAIGVLPVPLVSKQNTRTFRSRIDLVQMDVVVLDRDRRPVTGLTVEDFSLLVDGKPEPIVGFAAVTRPAVPSVGNWARQAAPDIVTNQRAPDGRLVVIVMDRSIPAGTPTLTARRIARGAVEMLAPDDQAAVVRTSRFSGEGVSQNFTSDKQRLFEAIDSPFIGFTVLPEMTFGGLAAPGNPSAATPVSAECQCGICVLDSLAGVAQALASVPESQKAIVFIGSEMPINDLIERGPCGARFRSARDRLFRELDRANVAIHVLDPRGLESLSRTTGAFPASGGPSRSANLMRQADLAVLPTYTGGQSFVNTNDVEAAVSKLFDEMRSYYLLAVRRSADSNPSQRRAIKVLVHRDGVSVRTRTGSYAAASSSAPLPTSSPLTGLLPKGDLPMRMALPLVFEPDGSTDVPIVVSPDLSAVGPPELLAAPHLTAVVAVFDDRARLLASDRVRAALETTAKGEWLANLSRLKRMKPGHYEVRVSAAVEGTTTIGSVFGYVTVPDVNDEKLTVANPVFTLTPLAARPTIRRTFSRDELVTVSAQVRCAVGLATPVVVSASVASPTSQIVDAGQASLSSCQPNAATNVEFALPLSRLSPDRYVLGVTASGGGHAQRRAVPFAVE